MKIIPKDHRREANRFFKALSISLAQGEIIQSAIVIAYYLLFSMFPIIIIIGNVLPLFNINTEPIADYVQLVFPAKIAKMVVPIMKQLLTSKSNGVLSFGVIVAIWSFSCLVNGIRIGMNRLYGVHGAELKQSMLEFLWVRGITVVLTTLMIVIFTGVALALIFGQQVFQQLEPFIKGTSLWEFRRLLYYRYHIVFILMVIAVYYLNYALPNIRPAKRVIWPGVGVTVLGWMALSWGFGFYLRHFNMTWKNYGIVGTFIIFMLYMNLAAMVLLFGTAVNAAFVNIRQGDLTYSAGRLAGIIRQRRRANATKKR